MCSPSCIQKFTEAISKVSADPPTISISFRNASNGQLKDTPRNILQTKNGFTVNLISDPWAENAHICATEFPQSESEWPASGLTQKTSVSVANYKFLTKSQVEHLRQSSNLPGSRRVRSAWSVR